MGGRGSASSKRSKARGSSQRSSVGSYDEGLLKNAAEDWLNHNLPDGATGARVTSVSQPDGSGYADVDYEMRFRFPEEDTDADGYVTRSYSYETEYGMQRIDLSRYL